MIKIISPEKKDTLGVVQVLYKTWLDTYPNKEFGITREDIEEHFRAGLTNEGLAERWEKIKNDVGSKTLIAKNGDLVVGVITIVFHADKNQLKLIYVLPEYQGQGIGKQLWEEIKKYFDISKKCIVQMVTYNTKAINFYKKLGFKDTGKRWNDEKRKMKSGAMLPEMEMELTKDLF
mgnify:CR=1 FL=1